MTGPPNESTDRLERDAMLRLTLAGGLGPRLTAAMLERFASATAAAEASVHQLQQVEGIGAKRAGDIRRELDEADVDAERQAIAEHGVSLLGIGDPAYPPLLRHIHDPPPLLYVGGRIDRADSVALALVGSRRCTAYGREQADRFASVCAQSGLTIVSGGARGIDTAAHQGAMRAGGRTIAVLGCGLGQCYPPENRELFATIAGRGAVISELPMSAPPIAENFPRRNRIISGLSLGVLVVEAALRSGALITARLAAEEHNREVMAVPGRVDSRASAGCHKIIREGWAALVTNAADVLDCLGEAGRTLREVMDDEAVLMGQTPPPDGEAADANAVDVASLTETQRKLYEAIGREPIDLDTVAETCGLPIAQLNAELTLLQLRGLIERTGGNRVRRRR